VLNIGNRVRFGADAACKEGRHTWPGDGVDIEYSIGCKLGSFPIYTGSNSSHTMLAQWMPRTWVSRMVCSFMCYVVLWMDIALIFSKWEFTGPDTRLAECHARVERWRTGWDQFLAKFRGSRLAGEQFQRCFPAYVADQEKENGSVMTSLQQGEYKRPLKRVLRKGSYRDIEIIAETAEFVSMNEEEWCGKRGERAGGNISIEMARMDCR